MSDGPRWTLNAVRAARDEALGKVESLAVSADRRAALTSLLQAVEALSRRAKKHERLDLLGHALAALKIEAIVLQLGARQREALASLAESLLRLARIEPQRSRLTPLWVEVDAARAAFATEEGRHFEALFAAERALARSGPASENDRLSLIFKRASCHLRLGSVGPTLALLSAKASARGADRVRRAQLVVSAVRLGIVSSDALDALDGLPDFAEDWLTRVVAEGRWEDAVRQVAARRKIDPRTALDLRLWLGATGGWHLLTLLPPAEALIRRARNRRLPLSRYHRLQPTLEAALDPSAPIDQTLVTLTRICVASAALPTLEGEVLLLTTAARAAARRGVVELAESCRLRVSGVLDSIGSRLHARLLDSRSYGEGP